MSTSIATFTFYPKGLKHLLSDESLQTGMTNLRAVLLTSAYTPNSAHEFVSDLSGEVTTNGGNRLTLTNVTVTIDGNYLILDCDDWIWTATGGDLTCRRFVLFDNTGGADNARNLIAHGLMNDLDVDVVATAGKNLKYIVPATGLFRVKQNGVA